jgi:hypothetical protein
LDLTYKEFILRKIRRAILLGFSASGAGLLLIPESFAHHGFGGSYDTSRPLYLRGQVASMRPSMPHPQLTLTISNPLIMPGSLPQAQEWHGRLQIRPEDAGKRLTVEFPPISTFLDLRPEQVIRTAVEVIVYRNCFAPFQLRGQWLRLSNGEIRQRMGRVQTEVASCTPSAKQ